MSALTPRPPPCAATTRLAGRGRAAARLPPASRRLKPLGAAINPSDFKASEQGKAASDDCRLFFDKNGKPCPVMCADYGFRTGTGKIYEDTDGTIPSNIWELATDNFKKELAALKGKTKGKTIVKDPEMEELRSRLGELQLDNQACWELECKRSAERGEDYAPFFISVPFNLLCFMTDQLFDGRPIQRFWFLEEVARMPYMAYISMMHLYESLGWFRAGMPVRKVHFAEEWNEMHHLLIMESLGGDQSWFDRFLAQHAAVFYFWLLCLVYAVSPQLAYKFSVLVEGHAIDTYDQFTRQNKEQLEQLPAPYVAVAYYLSNDVYMLDAFTTEGDKRRDIQCSNLYDVFSNIRDDEVEHEHTMDSCQANQLPKLLKEMEERDAEKIMDSIDEQA